MWVGIENLLKEEEMTIVLKQILYQLKKIVKILNEIKLSEKL